MALAQTELRSATPDRILDAAFAAVLDFGLSRLTMEDVAQRASLSRQKAEVEGMAALHERTIEALALAIESKDQAAQEHLQRLRLYAVEMAAEADGALGPVAMDRP